VILVLASCIIAYFAARTWHWAYVLVVVGIVFSTAGYYILAAETLRINSVLRRAYNRVEQQLAQENAKIVLLERGTDASPSVSDLEHQVRLQTLGRGPVWRGAAPTGVDPQTGVVQVSVEAPVPAGLAANTVVYLFEEGPTAQPDPSGGKQYLGEFRIVQAAGQQAELHPAAEMVELQRQRLANSRGPWAIYAKMPADHYGLFAGKSEEELRQLLPAASVDDYIRHGRPAGPDDDEYHTAFYEDAGDDEPGKRLTPDEREAAAAADRPVRTLYHRQLRDYGLEFRELIERRAVMLTDLAGLILDNQRLAEAEASALRLTTFRQEQLRKLNHDLDGINNKDRPALARLAGQVQQQLDTIRVLLDRALAENVRLARELAARQAAWTQAIDGVTSEGGAVMPLASGDAQ
jgi:hypothetical protein